MDLLTRGERLPRAVGAVLLVGVLLRVWNFAGGRSLWLDEAMVGLDIKYLTLSKLLGPLPFDQLAPAGWLLVEKACLYLWGNFDYALRLPSLVGGIAALFLFYRFLKYCTDAWETLAGVAMMAVIPVFIQYSSMVKPYILDVLFSVALLYASLVLLREQSGRMGKTALYGAIGIVCIPFAFGGTLVMAGTGTLLFVASVMKKAYRWSLALAAVGIVWALLFWAIYSLVYTHNANAITHMTKLYWIDSFAPLPTSLSGLQWYPSAAASAIRFLTSNSSGVVVMVIWIYGMVRIARRDPWLPSLLVSPIIATLVASMLQQYPFYTRFILGLAPVLFVGLSCGAVGIVRHFPQRSLAVLAVFAVLGFTPLKQTVRAASQEPPFPMEEIKPSLVYLKNHYRKGDELILNLWGERAFALYAERFGLSDLDYKVTTYFRLDPSCVYDDVRLIRNKRRAWLLFTHVINVDKPSVKFLKRALKQSGSLKLANTEPGSSLYMYTAGERTGAMQLPPSAAICSEKPVGEDFLDRIARRADKRG